MTDSVPPNLTLFDMLLVAVRPDATSTMTISEASKPTRRALRR